MKLVTFVHNNRAPLVGALIGGQGSEGRVVDIQAAWRARGNRAVPYFGSVLAIVERGQAAVDAARELIETTAAQDHSLPVAHVKLLAPIPQPPQMRDFLCFEKHLIQGFRAVQTMRARQSPDPEAALREIAAKGNAVVPQVWYERPIFYHPNRLNVIGTDTDVIWPAYSKLLDFELEFGCYIGKTGKDIKREEARAHIFGYTIFNDVSARDEQTEEMKGQLGPGKGKDFDTGNVMGPCLVTADEIPDPYALAMTARVNGEEWGRGNSRDMHWKFEDCIAHASRSETLVPGEFFASGTVGDGCGLEHMRFLKPNDVVELEVEGIGVLRNRVVRPKAG